LRHHRPAHGDTQTQIATSAFGATIPHGSANRHPSKPHKPRRFTPQCEKCGLARYDAVRRPASVQIVVESRRLGAYIEGKGKRADPITFMRENGGVETSNRADGGLFFRLLAKAGFA